MSKTRNGLIEHCKSKLGTPYVFGAKGEVMTQARINQLARENPGTYTSAYKAKAAKYIGQRCTDCSGLISWYTGRIRGSYNYHDTAVERVSIDHLNESMIGWALWKPGHIGVYIGDGYCIEAKGINYGTIRSKVSSTAWQKVLKLCDIDYTTDQAPTEQPKKSGWSQEDGGWRFYNGDTGEPVRNAWYQDGQDWYWFDGAGMMVRNTWYRYKGAWYYLGGDGAMCTGQVTVDGMWYIMDNAGRMIVEPVTLTPDQDGALRWPGLAE